MCIAKQNKHTCIFLAFLDSNQFHLVGLRFVCWFYVRNTQRLTESGFIEKPGIDPATPGLHDIGLSPTPRQLLLVIFISHHDIQCH